MRWLFLILLSCWSASAHALEWRSVKVDHGGLVRDPVPNPRYVPPPAWYEPGAAGKTGAITVNYNPSSCGTGALTWSNAAQDAFQKAVDIWAAILNTSVTIEIDACWMNNLPANVLGRAGPTQLFRNFDNAPQTGTFYPVALANQLAGEDLNTQNVDIQASFSSTVDWFLGLDQQTTTDQSNFVSVVLHEIGHGLGFTGFMTVDDGINNGTTNLNECNGTAGVGCWGPAGAQPSIYDRFTENAAGTAILSFANNSAGLGNQLTSDGVFFDGPTARARNGGAVAELYAPNPWEPGSSYSHLGEVFNETDDALMTFSISDGEVLHHPGEVAIGLLTDLGWDLRNLTTVFVDAANTSGVETGEAGTPFNTVFEGASAVFPRGTVFVTAGSYPESLVFVNAMTLQGSAGNVIVGN